MKKKLAILAVTGLLGLAGSSFLYGFLAAEHRLFPSEFVSTYESKLRRLPAVLKGRPPMDSVISTALLRLNARRIHVPADRDITNGSVTAVGKDLLLMAGSGEVFHYTSGADSVVRSGIAVPANHQGEFQSVAGTPKYADYTQDLYTRLRYLHLLHVEDGAQHLLFLSFTEWHPEDECHTNSIARLDVSSQGADTSKWSASPEDWQVIFRSRPCLPMKKRMRAVEAHISAGRMVFDAAQRRLVFTVGDFHWDGVFNDVILSQDDANDYGKVLSMDLDGGNPAHVAKGLRNAQGITLDDAGNLWVTEHGPAGGDELNLVLPDSNYGWPLATLGKGYNGLPWKPARQYGRHDEFVAPVYSWIPSVGLSSIVQVRGFDPAWSGDFLVGSMIGQTLYRLRIVDGRVLFAEPIPFGERIRYILQPEDGLIALWTDSRNLILLTRADDDDTGTYVENFIQRQSWTDRRKDAVRTAISACTQCHPYTPEPGRAAPYLVGVYNRRVASVEFPMYSGGLRALGGRWTEDRLAGFLADTQRVAPGSSMPQQNLQAETALDVVQVLKSLDAAD